MGRVMGPHGPCIPRQKQDAVAAGFHQPRTGANGIGGVEVGDVHDAGYAGYTVAASLLPRIRTDLWLACGRMRLLDRYLLRELLVPLLYVPHAACPTLLTAEYFHACPTSTQAPYVAKSAWHKTNSLHICTSCRTLKKRLLVLEGFNKT